ncbi:MAG: heavy-metal-associated domain-containing protein [Myxococcota bacterium]
MKRFLPVLAFSFAASGAAFACGDEKCDKSCAMPASTASAAPAELPAGTKVKLKVSGMTCGSCAEKVKTALLGVEGVKGATVDAASGLAEVSYDEKKASNDKLVAAVGAIGHFTASVAN